MVISLGVTKAITNLEQAHQQLNLRPAGDLRFFDEWQGDLPTLSLEILSWCDRLQARYRYYQNQGAITESTVNLIIIAPLLEFLGLHEPPYCVRGEKYVRIELEDGDRRLEGLIDVLVLRDHLWLLVLETKRYGFSVMQALPQTLAYLAAHPQGGPAYALITTGEDYLFVKAAAGEYDVSDKFTLSTRTGNALYRVVAIMQRLLQL